MMVNLQSTSKFDGYDTFHYMTVILYLTHIFDSKTITTYDTEKIRKIILKFTLNQVSCPLAFPLLIQYVKLPIIIEISVTIWQIMYIDVTAISPKLIS